MVNKKAGGLELARYSKVQQARKAQIPEGKFFLEWSFMSKRWRRCFSMESNWKFYAMMLDL